MPTASPTPTRSRPMMRRPPITGLQRVVVADDHPIYREGIVRALLQTGRYEIAGEASDGEATLELIHHTRPDVALVDLRMPKLDGLGVVRRLEREGSRVPLVLLSAFMQHQIVEQARAAGAAAYISKDASREEIVAAVDAVALQARIVERRSVSARDPGWDAGLADSQRRATIGRERAERSQAATSERRLVSAWLRELAHW